MERVLLIFLVIAFNTACFGQNMANPKILDSTSFFTITPFDTLRGHYSQYVAELDTFELIKRYYFHEAETSRLIGFDYPDKVHFKTYDKRILSGIIANGRKTGTWLYLSNCSEGFDFAKDGVWMHSPGYHVYYYSDSIVVHGFWGTEVKYDLVTGRKTGYLINGYSEPKHFTCDADSCEFINDNSPPGERIWYDLDGALWDIEKLHKITEVEYSN